jgi:hypothetical protein
MRRGEIEPGERQRLGQVVDALFPADGPPRVDLDDDVAVVAACGQPLQQLRAGLIPAPGHKVLVGW